MGLGLMQFIVPSRGRPDKAAELIEAWEATTDDAFLMFVVDDDDPMLNQYLDLPAPTFQMAERRRLGATLNFVATAFADGQPEVAPDFIGFMGDDHRPRTPHWDTAYRDALTELGSGFVYGDDLLQSERLPTQCAMTSDIIRTLGYMVPPGLVHLCLDSFWLEMGTAINRIRYLPDVVVEHLHPAVGKSGWDQTYEEANSEETMTVDAQRWQEYLENEFMNDVAKVKAIL